MKKLFALILTAAMVLGLCACGGAGGSKGEDGLQIGFAKVDITPKFEVSLSGYGDQSTRKNKDGFMDYVYVTCIAAKEGEETILFFTMDTIGFADARSDGFRELISKATGISGEKMFFGGTHTHNGPESDQYEKFIEPLIVQCAEEAIADLSPATISAATEQVENMNFIRHYKMEDGTYSGANFGNWSIKITEPAGTADKTMMVVKFERAAEDKKDVVLVNWQAHNDHAKALGYNLISAGYVGALRTELEKTSGQNVAFFMGASGNLNPSGRMDSEKHNLAWNEYGQKLAGIANDLLGKLEPVGGSGIASTTYTMDGKINHEWDHMINEAREADKMFREQGKDIANAWAIAQGFSSVYHARGVMSKYSRGESEALKMGAFRIHDLGFVTGPCEMFSETGMAIRKDSPFKYTFIIMGNKGYMPTEAAYDMQCYESHLCNFQKGTAENMHAKYTEMLGSIK